MSESESKIVKSNFFRRCRSSVWLVKHFARLIIPNIATCFFERDETKDKAAGVTLYILLWFRVGCKSIFGLACLGVCGYAIALPFCSSLQTLLGFDLRGFAKLLFSNNIGTILKLISVAGSALYVAVHYSLKAIGSVSVLVNLGNQNENKNATLCQRAASVAEKYSDICICGANEKRPKKFPISRFGSWAIEDARTEANRPFKTIENAVNIIGDATF
jgi:hypothetical protein